MPRFENKTPNLDLQDAFINFPIKKRLASLSLQPRFAVMLLATTLALAISNTALKADIIVTPIPATTEGGSTGSFPFGTTTGQRYQQVYSSSSFSSFGSVLFIDQIAFRVNGNQGNVSNFSIPNIQLNLSTTSQAVDGLSSTFASNVGTNDIIVFNGAIGPLNLTGNMSPNPFDLVFNLSTPFSYDPSAGNLLLDVRRASGGSFAIFDVVTTTGDAVSRVAGPSGNVNSLSGATSTSGLVTQFNVAAVPEPSTYAMMFLGLGAIAFVGWKRKRSESL
jgi:hypothetical protein